MPSRCIASIIRRIRSTVPTSSACRRRNSVARAAAAAYPVGSVNGSPTPLTLRIGSLSNNKKQINAEQIIQTLFDIRLTLLAYRYSIINNIIRDYHKKHVGEVWQSYRSLKSSGRIASSVTWEEDMYLTWSVKSTGSLHFHYIV